MVWGCMATNGVGNLAIIPTIMDKEVYQGILKDNLRISAKKLKLGRKFIFQQDQDPKHTANSTKLWFTKNKIDVMEWPPQSPDLNPIEHLWRILEIQIRSRPQLPRNAHELKQALLEEWEKISPNDTAKLVNSMQKRCMAVIEAKGGHTKY